MPDIIAIKKTQGSGVAVVSAGLVAGGLALLLFSLTKKDGIAPVPEGKLETPTSVSLVGPNAITVAIGATIPILDPIARYQGSGRDTYTHFRVVQVQNGVRVTVQGSGIAGVHVGPAATLTPYHLVAFDQPQPPDCPQQTLCAYPWPGPSPAPICGAPPVPGYADAYLEIYQKKDPQDWDGFASPTCNGRVPVARLQIANKILYV